MADPVVPTTSNSANDAPHHLNTPIESGQFASSQDIGDAEKGPENPSKEEGHVVVDDEDEDMDALIEELESTDEHDEEEEDEPAPPGSGFIIPEDLLQTSTVLGLTDAEVQLRRKKYGLNRMKEEKENLFLKFLGYFVGPVQFVMEVCSPSDFIDLHIPVASSLSLFPMSSTFPVSVP